MSLLLNNAASDYYQFGDLLTPKEQVLRRQLTACVEKDVAPIMTKVDAMGENRFNSISFRVNWVGLTEVPPPPPLMLQVELFDAEFPYVVVPKFRTLKVAGGTIKNYGYPGLSLTANELDTTHSQS